MHIVVWIIVSLGVAVAAVLVFALIAALTLAVTAIVAIPFAILRKPPQASEIVALLPPPAPVRPDPAVEALKADLKRQFAIEEMRTDAYPSHRA
jgi:hypothetical protein